MDVLLDFGLIMRDLLNHVSAANLLASLFECALDNAFDHSLIHLGLALAVIASRHVKRLARLAFHAISDFPDCPDVPLKRLFSERRSQFVGIRALRIGVGRMPEPLADGFGQILFLMADGLSDYRFSLL